MNIELEIKWKETGLALYIRIFLRTRSKTTKAHWLGGLRADVAE
jgi:hypothetical protein